MRPIGNRMKPSPTLLDRIFHTGITLKGIGGVLETIGGILLCFISPASMSQTVQWLFLQEFSRDPDGFLTTHVLKESSKLANMDPTFASLYLLSHGITKVALVVCLWLNKLWAYPLTMLVFAGFCVYQIHRYTRTHSIMLVLLTIFDLFLIYLTWREYLEQKQIRRQQRNE
jgi:uncharacterized membrane protein